ncbi:hypothetical protein [Candidatus Pollutiaquabacter sp.]|uniref:hypothetical protein n=1 Tax=Candidatus Pollutiaquabacter sp. TaxID=3416354 RepID=UPI003CA8A4F7|nr:hypothetical protein [Bacteroidota bacterium]
MRQAQVLGTLAAAGQIKLINKLLLQVSKDYLGTGPTRVYATAIARRITSAWREIALRRDPGFACCSSDQPAIDSMEALIEVQNRRTSGNQSLHKFHQCPPDHVESPLEPRRPLRWDDGGSGPDL